MAVSASQPHATTPAQPDAPAIPGTNTRVPSGFGASVLIGLLLAVAAGMGLFIPGIYEADTAAAFRGTDLVSLVVALPTLAVAVGLGVLSSNLFGYLDSGPTDGPLLGLWALTATASLLMLLRYLHAMPDQPIGPLANSAEHGHERN